MSWKQAQELLWIKWRRESPELSARELWAKNYDEWVQAYKPFVKPKLKEIPKWLRPF